MTRIVTPAVRMRWEAEAEEDARGLALVRDTLALVRAEDFPASSKARRAARQAEDIVTAIDLEFERYADYCPKCEEGDLDVRLSDRWTIRCKCCGWTVNGATWTKALENWNAEGCE